LSMVAGCKALGAFAVTSVTAGRHDSQSVVGEAGATGHVQCCCRDCCYCQHRWAGGAGYGIGPSGIDVGDVGRPRNVASAPVRSDSKIAAATYPVDLRHDRSAPLCCPAMPEASGGSLPNELAQAIVELLDKLGQ
jgi:hypothetical protein